MSKRPIGDLTTRVANILAESIISLDLLICNVGRNRTFVREPARSIIDVTFTTPRAALAIKDWRVLSTESLSLHTYIAFLIGDASTPLTKNVGNG